MMRLAQRAYPEFNYTASDQVARDQFVHGLSDIDMKRHADLGSSSSLDEAVMRQPKMSLFSDDVFCLYG